MKAIAPDNSGLVVNAPDELQRLNEENAALAQTNAEVSCKLSETSRQV